MIFTVVTSLTLTAHGKQVDLKVYHSPMGFHFHYRNGIRYCIGWKSEVKKKYLLRKIGVCLI